MASLVCRGAVKATDPIKRMRMGGKNVGYSYIYFFFISFTAQGDNIQDKVIRL